MASCWGVRPVSSPFHLDNSAFLDFLGPHQTEGDLLGGGDLPGLKPSNCALFQCAEAGGHQVSRGRDSLQL